MLHSKSRTRGLTFNCLHRSLFWLAVFLHWGCFNVIVRLTFATYHLIFNECLMRPSGSDRCRSFVGRLTQYTTTTKHHTTQPALINRCRGLRLHIASNDYNPWENKIPVKVSIKVCCKRYRLAISEWLFVVELFVELFWPEQHIF